MQTGAPEAPQGDIDVGPHWGPLRQWKEGWVGPLSLLEVGVRSGPPKDFRWEGGEGTLPLPNQAGTGEMCDGPVSSEARHRFSLRAMSG